MAISLLVLANSMRSSTEPAVASGPSLYQSGGQHRTISAALALGGAGLVIVGLMTALVAPDIIPTVYNPIDTINIPVPPPPKPETQPQPDAQRPESTITAMKPIVDLHPPVNDRTLVTIIPDRLPPIGDVGTGPTVIREIIIAPPLLTAARRDPRFGRSFQPSYPAAEQRNGTEGACPVSVTIAPSGRVSAVRDMGCSNPAFFRATQRQALGSWRFQPATRDGVPVESVLTQNVVFDITE